MAVTQDNSIQAPTAEDNAQVYVEAATDTVLSSRVRLQVRVSDDGEAWSEWLGPDGTPNTYFETSPGSLASIPAGRYIQWHAYLSSDGPELSGMNGPQLRDVMITNSHTYVDNTMLDNFGENLDNLGADNLSVENIDNLAVEGPKKTNKVKKVRIGRVSAGNEGVADFREHRLLLKRVKITPALDVDNVDVFVDLLGGRPAGVPPIDEVGVYAYMDLSTTVQNSDIVGADIEFSLPKTFVESLGVWENTITTYRYHGGRWENLPTTRIWENADEVLFSARTPGFSPFAITYVASEIVYEGMADPDGTPENAQTDDGVYENVRENAYPFGTSVKTVEFYIGMNGANDIASQSWPFTFYIPESSPVLDNIYIEVTASLDAGADATVAVNINGSNSISHTVDGSGESVRFKIFYDADPVITSISQGLNGPYTLNVSATAGLLNELSARLHVTYRYDPSSTTQVKTAKFFINQDTVSRAAGSTVSWPINFYIPESSPVLENVYVVVRALPESSADPTLTVDIGGSNQLSVIIDAALEATELFALYDAKAQISSITQGMNGPYTLNLGNTGDTVTLWSAELVVTYRHAARVYRENVQHNITGIPTSDNYSLEIEYYTAGDSEPVSVYLYNFSTGSYENKGNIVGGSAPSPNLFRLDNLPSNYISSGEVRVRYVQPDNDYTRTDLMIDFVRVISHGFLNVESWSGTAYTTAGWYSVETWSGSVGTIVIGWKSVESWGGTV
ncbi:MAG: PGF-pre-PGF domain-containing protein, partial [Candidatus Zixiibacteriota bacterium]